MEFHDSVAVVLLVFPRVLAELASCLLAILGEGTVAAVAICESLKYNLEAEE